MLAQQRGRAAHPKARLGQPGAHAGILGFAGDGMLHLHEESPLPQVGAVEQVSSVLGHAKNQPSLP